MQRGLLHLLMFELPASRAASEVATVLEMALGVKVVLGLGKLLPETLHGPASSSEWRVSFPNR